ncbi:MAG: 4Fe-4S dicluster domain-containing protein [Chloroflexi bacterium]|nr:4Fe-4S dicluster domain-containing protein [Chloroflexota bacterium]
MASENKRRWGFVIEPKRCIDCKACMVACEIENAVPLGKHRNWIGQIGPTGTFPVLGMKFEPGNCMHCENPPCERVCPTGATYQREDGIVLVDYDRCIGCRYCMQACPYDARYPHTDGYVDKCTFCVHRLDTGQPPACVETCVGGARHFGDLNDPNSEVAKLLATRDHYVVYEEAGTKPKIFYIA